MIVYAIEVSQEGKGMGSILSDQNIFINDQHFFLIFPFKELVSSSFLKESIFSLAFTFRSPYSGLMLLCELSILKEVWQLCDLPFIRVLNHNCVDCVLIDLSEFFIFKI